ncbi:MAG: hypothetical protein WCG06_03650, partial [Candidatus Omnitrophota bacterium]
ILKFLLGFASCIVFMFLSGNTLTSLERALIISFVISLIFGYRQLRSGFILQWGSVIFFAWCIIMVNCLNNVTVAKNMGVIANGFLASIIWLTILVKKPFTLQYAREDLPKERWHDPRLVQSCRFIAIVWGALMAFSTLVACFKVIRPGAYPEIVYSSVSIGTIMGGTLFTQFYKKRQRAQAAKLENN